MRWVKCCTGVQLGIRHVINDLEGVFPPVLDVDGEVFSIPGSHVMALEEADCG